MTTPHRQSPADRKFASRMLGWYARGGRKDLPWRGAGAYRVWVSEIMLQQTQVAAVIPYYRRFLARFPDIAALAASDSDALLHCWSGLGYYARARNLRAAAQVIVAQYGGEFPARFDDAHALPGIGRSTAGAILSFAYQQRHPILDGNVRRVLSRVFAVGHGDRVKDDGGKNLDARLWEIAERLTPASRVADYNQAMMDFGATVCKRGKPLCETCPLAADCKARALGDPTAFPPRKTTTRARRCKAVTMLILRNRAGELLLIKRPPRGIWGGLWSLPEFDGSARNIKNWCEQQLGLTVDTAAPLPQLKHSFTHFDLDIQPLPARVTKTARRKAYAIAADQCLWYDPNSPAQVGLPTAVKRIFRALK